MTLLSKCCSKEVKNPQHAPFGYAKIEDMFGKCAGCGNLCEVVEETSWEAEYKRRFLEKRLLSDGSSSEYIHLKGTALDKDFQAFIASLITEQKKGETWRKGYQQGYDEAEAKGKAEMEKLIEEIPNVVTDCTGDGGECGKVDEQGRRWDAHRCEHNEFDLTSLKQHLRAKYLNQ